MRWRGALTASSVTLVAAVLTAFAGCVARSQASRVPHVAPVSAPSATIPPSSTPIVHDHASVRRS